MLSLHVKSVLSKSSLSLNRLHAPFQKLGMCLHSTDTISSAYIGRPVLVQLHCHVVKCILRHHLLMQSDVLLLIDLI